MGRAFGTFLNWPCWKFSRTALLVSAAGCLALLPTAGASENTLSDGEAEELIEAIEADARWAEEQLNELKSDHLDREVLVQSLDYDPEAIRAWVAEHTLWVPYVGRLRGADGVLMDRRGNSLDRSLLLSALLEDAGVETRIARAELSETAAAQLLAPLASDDPRSVGPELEASKKLRSLYKELEVNARSLAKMAGLDDGPASRPNPEQLLTSIRDHWWVQAKKGGTWVDLDPLMPRGSTLSPPAPREIFTVPMEVPHKLQHRMKLSVVIERWEGGALFEEVALTQEITPTDAVRGHTLELEFNPFNQAWMDDDSANDLDTREIANGAELWLPILEVDGENVERGEWISKAGTLVKDPTRWVVDKKMGQATGAIAALGASSKEEEPDGHLTAVWIDYEIHRPGDAPRRVRRELSDILEADRSDRNAVEAWSLNDEKRLSRGLALQTHSIALISIAMPQRVALEHAIHQSWIDNRSSQIAMVYLAAGRQDDRIDPSLRTAKPYPVDLLGMMTARSLWSRQPDRYYQDEINIWSNHLVWPEASGTEEPILVTDIVANRVGAIATGPFEAKMLRIEQGMLDTFIEQHLAPDGSEPNAWGQFAERAPGKRAWSVLISTGQDHWPRDLPPMESARLATAIEGGARVVVSDDIVELGDQKFSYWWQIDPGDGTTLGIGYRGWGSQYTERGAINVPSKVFDAAQKRGIVTRACKVGTAIVKIVNVVTIIENPVMIDIDYVIELERKSLYTTQQRSRWRLCPK